MSQETTAPIEETTIAPKTTKVKKEKDPERVEAGKRLAAISKAAKERKMRDKIESENDSYGFEIYYGLLIGFLRTAVAIESLYYTRKDYERQTKRLETIKEEGTKPEPKNVEIERSVKIKTKNNNFDTFD